uniref:filamin/ABP280 repeat domain-containing protein n=1 Tax=Salmonella sp. s51228 TaxID=3159652 RepID=UPI00397F5257
NDLPSPKNPYQIDVSQPEPDASKVKVSGDGVKRGIVGKPLEFFIDTRGAGFGNIELSLEGPSKCDADCEDHGNGTCSVKYTPSEYGDYQVGLKFAGEDVPGSPFIVKVCDPSKVKASGPGITGIGAQPQNPALVILDVTDAGEGDFSV